MAQRKKSPDNIVAMNKRARRNYEILEVLEAGIILKGDEVKSLREGRASITESFASDKHGELYLQNAYIPAYSSAAFALEPRAARKLLLHRREISKFLTAIQRKGMTIVPLSIYFNKRGLAKVQLACAIGKQKQDRRETIKQRDWSRQKSRLLRRNN